MMPSVYLILPATSLLVIAIALWVAIVDFLFMHIPNAAHVVLLLVFAVFVWPDVTLDEAMARTGVAGAIFAVTLFLHTRGVMGAGDVKFLAVSALFIPAEPIILIAWLVVVAVAGPLVFGAHRAIGLVVPNNRFPSFSDAKFFPYGPAISIGLITIVVMSGMSG